VSQAAKRREISYPDWRTVAGDDVIHQTRDVCCAPTPGCSKESK
jgi:hypothetical protein